MNGKENIITNLKSNNKTLAPSCEKEKIAKILQGFCQSASNESNIQKENHVSGTIQKINQEGTNLVTDDIPSLYQVNNEYNSIISDVINDKDTKTEQESRNILGFENNGYSNMCFETQKFNAMICPQEIAIQKEINAKEALPCFRHVIHMPCRSIQKTYPFYAQRLDNKMDIADTKIEAFQSLAASQITEAPLCNFIKIPTQEPTVNRNFKPLLCRIVGCYENAKSRSPYCKKHSGPRKCEYANCSKFAQGQTIFCISHGGGRRCNVPGCTKAARDRNFCAAHGGGRRCNEEGCSKVAVGGFKKCTAHGGGKRCKAQGCDKAAQSSSIFCVRHGGGRRCIVDGCTKVARGKISTCMAHRTLRKDFERLSFMNN